MPPVVTAPSHSRTYRSHSPARAASCSLVAGPSAAAANKPVRWPMSTIELSRLPVRIDIMCPPKASALAPSKVARSRVAPSGLALSNVVWVVVIVVLPVVGDPIIRATPPGPHPWNHGP